MRTRVIALCAAVGIALAGCGSHHKASEAHYDSAQAIASALAASGHTVGALTPDTAGYIAQNGGKSYNTTIAPLAGSAGIDMFADADALKTWASLSKSLGGVAVTGDTWAVSLPTGTSEARSASEAAAPDIAKTLGGTVTD